MEIWNQRDFDTLGSFDPSQYEQWLNNGLEKWADPLQTYLAFEPVQDRFNLGEPIEYQLVEMARKMPETMRRAFIEGASLSLMKAFLSHNTVIFEPLTIMKTVLGAPYNLITIQDPTVLQQYGWVPPYPSYVTAAPTLWKLWLDRKPHARR